MSRMVMGVAQPASIIEVDSSSATARNISPSPPHVIARLDRAIH